MGRIIRCAECGEIYQELETIENLRENDGICLVCNAPIEVADWDRVLSSYEDEDFDDVDAISEVDDDDEEWRGDVEIDDDDFDDDDEFDLDEDEEPSD